MVKGGDIMVHSNTQAITQLLYIVTRKQRFIFQITLILTRLCRRPSHLHNNPGKRPGVVL